MDDIVMFLERPWVSLAIGVGGLILGIVGLIATIRSRQAKQLRWAIRTTNLVRDYTGILPNLSVLYGNERVERLSISTIMLCNRESTTINGEDISTASPLRIFATNDVVLLSAEVLTVNSPASQLTCELDAGGKHADVSFDFLDKSQGGLLRVIHDGISSNDLTLEGVIKGAGVPRRVAIRDPMGNFERKVPLSLLVSGVVAVLIDNILRWNQGPSVAIAWADLVATVTLGFGAFYSVALWWPIIMDVHGNTMTVPKGLESFHRGDE